MFLFRPVGEKEYQLIEESGFRKFPPRLAEQPIFYPVLNKKYASEIAEKWNTKDSSSGHKGYVLKFQVQDDFLTKFPVQTAGRSYHQELWIPAEELEELNKNIIGEIQVLKEFS